MNNIFRKTRYNLRKVVRLKDCVDRRFQKIWDTFNTSKNFDVRRYSNSCQNKYFVKKNDKPKEEPRKYIKL